MTSLRRHLTNVGVVRTAIALTYRSSPSAPHQRILGGLAARIAKTQKNILTDSAYPATTPAERAGLGLLKYAADDMREMVDVERLQEHRHLGFLEEPRVFR